MIDFLDIENKTILITGASGGIGSATARLLSELGANVILTGRDAQKLSEVVIGDHTKSKSFACDLSIGTEISRLITDLPSLDGVVHTAGIVKPMPVKFLKEKHISEMMNINFNAPILLTSELLAKKKINKGCSIVFISSISSQFPYLGGAIYSSSKAALESFAKTLALEHFRTLRSNIISPGLVRTAILDETAEATGEVEMKLYEQKYPLGFGHPIDVANAVGFLMSNRSKWITGENLRMDGGLTIGSK